MFVRHNYPWIFVLLVLLFAALACAEIDEFFALTNPTESNPTATPTAFITPEPPEYTAEVSDGVTLVLTQSGNRTEPGPSGFEGVKTCSTTTDLTLTIQPNGLTSLTSMGAGFIDHYNCTIDKSTEGWYIEGKADMESQTITFETCNFGGFTAYGTFIYNTFGFSGTVDCISKQTGEKGITINATQ